MPTLDRSSAQPPNPANDVHHRQAATGAHYNYKCSSEVPFDVMTKGT